MIGARRGHPGYCPGACIDVVLAPSLLEVTDLRDACCAVIDVLRASTSIVTAMAAGTREVVPCHNGAHARARAADMVTGTYLLAGERDGQRIEGFDLGNSPREYSDPARVRGKTILLATTNGTPLLRRVHEKGGRQVRVAAFVNATAVAEAMANTLMEGRSRKVVLVCAGQNGRPGLEDIMCAGFIINKIHIPIQDFTVEFSDGAQVAAATAPSLGNNLRFRFEDAEHGAHLYGIGFEGDLEFAARVDACSVVPVFNGRSILPQ